VNLKDLTGTLHHVNPELTIYARAPWKCDSEAALALEPADQLVPSPLASQGFTYFLEVFVATDLVPDLSQTESGLTLEQWCEKLIQYAQTDA
jgi:hypothetical protein